MVLLSTCRIYDTLIQVDEKPCQIVVMVLSYVLVCSMSIKELTDIIYMYSGQLQIPGNESPISLNFGMIVTI